MAGKPGFNLPGIPQHVIQRGNNREPCFYAKDDYYRYLHDLEESAENNHCAILAYVLMTNHVHSPVTPFGEHGVSHMMQAPGRKYVRYINHVYRRSGTLREGRLKDADIHDCFSLCSICHRCSHLLNSSSRLIRRFEI